MYRTHDNSRVRICEFMILETQIHEKPLDPETDVFCWFKSHSGPCILSDVLFMEYISLVVCGIYKSIDM